MGARDELARDIFLADNTHAKDAAADWSDGLEVVRDYAYAIAEGLIAAGYSKPCTIMTAEELDALPVGSVVLSDDYRHHVDGWQVAFQRWDDGEWHRGGRSAETHPDNFLPATVLHEPS